MNNHNNIVAQARTWLGTPFHHQARLKGIDVRSQLAVMNAQIQTLTKTVDVLAEEVKSLTALANQGKPSRCGWARHRPMRSAAWKKPSSGFSCLITRKNAA